MKKKTILLVEDDAQDELLTLKAFGKINLNNEVIVVRDGQQAVDYLLKQGAYAERIGVDLPSVVLMDLNLPRLSGLEVLKRLRADPRTELLPVAIFTSSGEEQDRLSCYKKGANSFVRKPLDFAEFVEAVARLGIYWLALNESPT